MIHRSSRRRAGSRAARPAPAPTAAAALAAEPLEARRLLASPAYELVDLGTFGGAASAGYGLNAAGQVVGYAHTADGARHAFRFQDANNNAAADPGELVDLGVIAGFTESIAYGINDSGMAVGSVIAGGNKRAAGFPAAGGPALDLGMGDGSVANAVNASGTIVGGATLQNRYQAFRRGATGALTWLGILGGSGFGRYSEAMAINDAGLIAGYSSTDAGDTAFLHAGSTMTPIGFPSPAGLEYDYAWDVNAAGHAAGEGFNADGQYRAFRYAGGAATDLGVPDGFVRSEGLGLNDVGDVVGRARLATGEYRAFLYREGVITDLNALLAPGSGWTLTTARAINDAGLIVANGTNASGQSRAALLLPLPQSVTVAGTAGDDVITLRLSPANPSRVQAFLNGGATPIASFPLTTPEVLIEAGDGDDVIELLDPLPALPALAGGAGADRLRLAAGTHALAADLATLSIERLEVRCPATRITSAASQHLASLEVAEGGRLSLPADAAAFVRAGIVSVTGGGALDVGAGALLVEAGGSQATLDALAALVSSGRNDGPAPWSGPGITSSAAAAEHPALGLSAALNANSTGAPLLAYFLGEELPASLAIVKFGPAADVNLDGRVDAADYHAIDAGFALGRTGFAHGDVDHSLGPVTADDYLVADAAFMAGAAAGQAPAAQAAAPPAPVAGRPERRDEPRLADLDPEAGSVLA